MGSSPAFTGDVLNSCFWRQGPRREDRTDYFLFKYRRGGRGFADGRVQIDDFRLTIDLLSNSKSKPRVGSGCKLDPAISQTHSSSDTVTVSFGNVRPVANAGKSQSVKVGDTLTLAGDGTDANRDSLSYRWILSSLPEGSLSEIFTSTS